MAENVAFNFTMFGCLVAFAHVTFCNFRLILYLKIVRSDVVVDWEV